MPSLKLIKTLIKNLLEYLALGLSLRRKITALNLFVVFALFAVSIGSYSVYNRIMEENTIKAVQQLGEQAAKKLDSYLNDVINATMLPLYNDELMYTLEYRQDSEIFTSGLGREMDTMLYSTIFVKDEVFSVVVFDMDKMRFYKVKKGSIASWDNIVNEPWYALALEDKSRVVFTGIHEIPNTSDVSKNERTVFSAVRQLYSVNLSKPVGLILISTNTDIFRKLLSEITVNDSQRVMIVDKDGGILFDNGVENRDKPVELSKLIQLEGSNSDYCYKSVGRDKYFVSCSGIPASGWRIISCVPVRALTMEVNSAWQTIVFINLLICVVVFALTSVLSSRFVSPLKKLVLLMKQVGNGDFSAQFKVRGRDEIAELSSGFNQMLDKISNLIKQVYQTQLRRKEAELNALQTQINPHFIHNTLESIHMMAELNDDHETSKMVQTLGGLLQYSISLKNQKVTVADEIQHLMDYLYIQGIRFENKFEVKFEIEEELYGREMIKLILQPLVENAIYHGLEKRQEKGNIIVRGYDNGTNMVFQIHDDGIGIGEERMGQLNRDINSVESTSRSIGLRNVNERIKLHYGENYGIQVFSVEGRGTIVKVFLPSTGGGVRNAG